MGNLEIKGITIGEGIPKIIVSLMGSSAKDLIDQAERGRAAGADLFEYRADFTADPHDEQAIIETARAITKALPHNPLLFTFRTKGQGGETELLPEELRSLYAAIIEDAAVDAIDIESWLGDDVVRALCDAAREREIASVVSFHDFAGTPPVDEMVSMLEHFRELGADIPKIAVMANSTADVIALLAATERVSCAETAGPIQTIAMGAQGSITRLAGEIFGSALTFCALDRASAPGQVDAAQAKHIMQELHEITAKR